MSELGIECKITICQNSKDTAVQNFSMDTLTLFMVDLDFEGYTK